MCIALPGSELSIGNPLTVPGNLIRNQFFVTKKESCASLFPCVICICNVIEYNRTEYWQKSPGPSKMEKKKDGIGKK